MACCGDQSQAAQVEARMTTEEPMPKLEQPKYEGNKANDKYPDASTAAPGQQQKHNEKKGMLDKIKEMLPGMS
ncbi:Dehydrin - like 2 [Theobroma cacao]|nr:Dehydrin - like 2 [Theobroma cacao]